MYEVESGYLAAALLQLIRQSPAYAEAMRTQVVMLEAVGAASRATAEHSEAVEKLFALAGELARPHEEGQEP